MLRIYLHYRIHTTIMHSGTGRTHMGFITKCLQNYGEINGTLNKLFVNYNNCLHVPARYQE